MWKTFPPTHSVCSCAEYLYQQSTFMKQLLWPLANFCGPLRKVADLCYATILSFHTCGNGEI